jgi:hypothetical protein
MLSWATLGAVSAVVHTPQKGMSRSDIVRVQHFPAKWNLRRLLPRPQTGCRLACFEVAEFGTDFHINVARLHADQLVHGINDLT